MTSIRDDKGYNQGFRPSKALTIRTERRCAYMIGKMRLDQKIKIMEIGCGTGELANLLAQKTEQQVLGIDICRTFIDQAKEDYRRPNLSYDVLDFNDDKSFGQFFQDKKFDYIVGNGVLHHFFYNLDDVLKKIHTLLNEDGKIIFLEPNIFNPYCFSIFKLAYLRKIARLEPGEMAFSKKFITAKLISSGFIDPEVEYKDFLLPNIPAFLIRPSIVLGQLLEKVPLLRMVSQSIFISARK
ncbi:MAG: class I SAM-dependent methyltransferase [Candidatus Yanofskybacteria bacterium]|nr:class I SAM-dependent methyltransferase [Candidatus Yanofskybacteria bacterium]